jgi:hypothetical protein
MCRVAAAGGRSATPARGGAPDRLRGRNAGATPIWVDPDEAQVHHGDALVEAEKGCPTSTSIARRLAASTSRRREPRQYGNAPEASASAGAGIR